MNLVFSPTNGQRDSTQSVHDAPKIPMQAVAPFRSNPGLALLCRENQVAMQIDVGRRHGGFVRPGSGSAFFLRAESDVWIHERLRVRALKATSGSTSVFGFAR